MSQVTKPFQIDLFNQEMLKEHDWRDEWIGMPEYNNTKPEDPEITATFKFKNKLDAFTGSPFVYILDKEKSLRGRKGQKIKGKVEYRECYNTISAAELHNEMSDDVKILLREYRLALKKNKRKDDFRDKIEQEVIKK